MSSIDSSAENSQPTLKVVNKNKKSLLLVLFAFALPIILAKMALEQEWLDLGVTNQGNLLHNELTLSQLGLSTNQFSKQSSKQWLILYALPEQCLAACLKTLETVHSAYVVLGKDMPRVTPVALTRNNFTVEQNKQLATSQWVLQPMPEEGKNIIKESQIFIVDPLGNLILSHTIPKIEAKQQDALGKAIIADMKKLLKYSKVG